jgi:hypothetical protein
MRERFWRWVAGHLIDALYPLVVDRLVARERERRREMSRLISLVQRQQKGDR